ncbi:MAG: rod-binding protein [Qingshengfaniella sp.]
MKADPAGASAGLTPQVLRDRQLREASIKLEAQFLSEMLKASGFDGEASSFSGGIGEEQFSSFLRDAQADGIARAGGIGLAESLYNALRAKDGGN